MIRGVDMIIVNDRPCNGVDLSHWNHDVPTLDLPWLLFFGHKASHINGARMVDGVDPKFAQRRVQAAEANVRWRAFYHWVSPPHIARAQHQVANLEKAVGELSVGESVYLDWEDKTVPMTFIEEMTYYMDLMFTARWFMYVNDATPDMTSWMESNKQTEIIALMHPNYNLDLGLIEARKWNSTVWQTGVGTPPGFQGEVPIDFVMQPVMMDWVCGRI